MDKRACYVILTILFLIVNISAECVDSDNSKDYFTKGSVSFDFQSIFGESKIIKEDYCQTTFFGEQKNLIEFYCEGDKLRSEIYNCPNGCKDGVCIREKNNEKEQSGLLNALKNSWGLFLQIMIGEQASNNIQPTSTIICLPNCAGRICGSDSCQGSCGNCNTGDICDSAGQCISSFPTTIPSPTPSPNPSTTIPTIFVPSPTPSVSPSVIESSIPTPNPSQSTTTMPSLYPSINPSPTPSPNPSTTIPTIFVPAPTPTPSPSISPSICSCERKTCGDNGCGVSCGTCSGLFTCNNGICTSFYHCSDSDIDSFHSDGINPNIPGYVSGFDPSLGSYILNDSCEPYNKLYEYYCSGPSDAAGTSHQFTIINCLDSCIGGHCIDADCVPASCSQMNKQCGNFTDQTCGRTINCGNCDDNNICTTDSCDSSGSCSHQYIPNCCSSDPDCNQNNKCQDFKCVNNKCQYSDKNCNDQDSCTADSCVSTSGCLHTKISGCGSNGGGGGGTGGGGTTCVPNCVNRICGSNGCGGSCGVCSSGTVCNSNGICVSENSDSMNPIVNLINPENQENFCLSKNISGGCINNDKIYTPKKIVSNPLVNFSAKISDNILVKNATLYIWDNQSKNLVYKKSFDVNAIFILVNNSYTLYPGTFIWNYYACDSSNNCAWNSTNYTVTYQPCFPNNCSMLNKKCGFWSDSCGGQINCGQCNNGLTCNSSGKCQAICLPKNCSQQGINCGIINDGCGNNISCGFCSGKCDNGICNAFKQNYTINWIEPNVLFFGMDKNNFTKLSFNVCCLEDNGCSDAKVRLYYSFNFTDHLVSDIKGDKPFYVNTSNPFIISFMNKNECQNVTFWMNATGDEGTSYSFFGEVNPVTSSIGGSINQPPGQCTKLCTGCPNSQCDCGTGKCRVGVPCCPSASYQCIKCNPNTLTTELSANGVPCYIGQDGTTKGVAGVCYFGSCLTPSNLVSNNNPMFPGFSGLDENTFSGLHSFFQSSSYNDVWQSEECQGSPNNCKTSTSNLPFSFGCRAINCNGIQDQPNDNLRGNGFDCIEDSSNPSCCCPKDTQSIITSPVQTDLTCSATFSVYDEPWWPSCKEKWQIANPSDWFQQTQWIETPDISPCPLSPLISDFPVGYNWANNRAFQQSGDKSGLYANIQYVFISPGLKSNCISDWFLTGEYTNQGFPKYRKYYKCKYMIKDDVNFNPTFGTGVKCCLYGSYTRRGKVTPWNCNPPFPATDPITGAMLSTSSSVQGCAGTPVDGMVTDCLPPPIVTYEQSNSQDLVVSSESIENYITNLNKNPQDPSFSCDSNNCELKSSTCKLTTAGPGDILNDNTYNPTNVVSHWDNKCLSKCRLFQSCDSHGNCLDECKSNYDQNNGGDCPSDKQACLQGPEGTWNFIDRPDLSSSSARCVSNFCTEDSECPLGKTCSMTYYGSLGPNSGTETSLYRRGLNNYGECADAECKFDESCGVDDNGNNRICGSVKGVSATTDGTHTQGSLLVKQNVCSDNTCDGDPLTETRSYGTTTYVFYRPENSGKKFCPDGKTCESGKCVDINPPKACKLYDARFGCFNNQKCINHDPNTPQDGTCGDCKTDDDCKELDSSGNEKCPKLVCVNDKCVIDQTQVNGNSVNGGTCTSGTCPKLADFSNKECAKSEIKLTNKYGKEVCIENCPIDQTPSDIGDYCADLPQEIISSSSTTQLDQLKVQKATYSIKTGSCGQISIGGGQAINLLCGNGPSTIDILNVQGKCSCSDSTTGIIKYAPNTDDCGNVCPDAPLTKCDGDIVKDRNDKEIQDCNDYGICYECVQVDAHDVEVPYMTSGSYGSPTPNCNNPVTKPDQTKVCIMHIETAASCKPKKEGTSVPDDVKNSVLGKVIGDSCSAGEGSCKTNGNYICDGYGKIICNAKSDDSKKQEEIACNGIDENCNGIADDEQMASLKNLHCQGGFCNLLKNQDQIENCFFELNDQGDYDLICPSNSEEENPTTCTMGCNGESSCCSKSKDSIENSFVDIENFDLSPSQAA